LDASDHLMVFADIVVPAGGSNPCNNNGVCEAGENCTNCPGDCISGSGAQCGNGICEVAAGEDCLSCPADCNGVQGGKPANRFCCGDGAGENPVGCADGRCNSGGFTCSDAPITPSCCGDGVCEGVEDPFNCEIDCGPPPVCGDGNCDGSEDVCSCPGDCGPPPAGEIVGSTCNDGIDNDCDGVADCDDGDCVGDPSCPACDNDGVCDPGEDCTTCGDCDGKQNGPPSGRYCCGNGVLEGPEGDGAICDGNP
jgi:hypothetical protein